MQKKYEEFAKELGNTSLARNVKNMLVEDEITDEHDPSNGWCNCSICDSLLEQSLGN